MEIKTFYKTSKGIFDSFYEASKKSNRLKDTDGRDGGFIGYEPVREVWLLVDSNTGRTFELTEVTIT